jgi:hypothetical protein
MKNYFSKTMLVILITCLFSGNLFAQGLYVNVNAGYGSGINKSTISDLTETATTYTYNQKSLSFGKGINFGGAIGYMFTKNMGAELGLSYLIGGKSKSTGTYLDRTESSTYDGKMLKINPSFIFTAGTGKFNPYAKMGLVVGFGSFNHDYSVTYKTDNVNITSYKYNGGMALGFSSALGATYKLNNNLSLFGELNLISLSYSPEKGVVTKYTNNGTDLLPSMTMYDNEVDFVDSYTVNRTGTTDTTKPRQTIKVPFPFGSFGFNFGIRINLAKYMNEVKKSTH